MLHKSIMLYAWLVRTLLFFMPDIPFIMRMRGCLYGLAMKKCGKNFQVAHSAIINGLDFCIVGDDVYIANGCNIVLNGVLTIGNYVMFGPGIMISTGDHIFAGGNFRFTSSKKQDVSIGEGSWIGGNSSILGDAKIPDRSVIAAGSVVTRHSCNGRSGVYAGVPAKFVKPLN